MEKQFVNLMDAPFSRRGSYFCFANGNQMADNIMGKSTLWLCNCRILEFAMTDFTKSNNFRQIQLQAVRENLPLPCFLNTTPEEVILETPTGEIRFCIAEPRLMMAHGENGLALRIACPPGFMGGPSYVPIEDGLGSYDLDFGPCQLRVTPLCGTFRPWHGGLELVPDENGALEAAFVDFNAEPLPKKREEYPSYQAGVESVRKEFDEFCERVMPDLPEEFEPRRLQALWQTWSLMVDPDEGNDYKRPMVKMMHSVFESAFGWQMPMQAIFLHHDPQLSWEIFCSCFEFQDRNGRLSDAVSFKHLPGKASMKPPIHGMALLWLMDHGVIDAAAPPLEDKQWLLERLIEWTEFFFRFRPGKGSLCAYQRALETGWEDAPQYFMGMPMICPDLNTFLALNLEAIARFGETIGMLEEAQAIYRNRSRQVIDEMVETLWDGDRWFCLGKETGARSVNDNVTLCLPLLLGDRLPKEILDKTIAHLLREGGFKTENGYASEALDSLFLHHGFSAGSVITPTHFFVPIGLESCGYEEEAKDAARSYCRTLKRNGFFHICNALTGREDRSLTAFGESQLFWSSWTSSCYLFLADRYGR